MRVLFFSIGLDFTSYFKVEKAVSGWDHTKICSMKSQLDEAGTEYIELNTDELRCLESINHPFLAGDVLIVTPDTAKIIRSAIERDKSDNYFPHSRFMQNRVNKLGGTILTQ